MHFFPGLESPIINTLYQRSGMCGKFELWIELIMLFFCKIILVNRCIVLLIIIIIVSIIVLNSLISSLTVYCFFICSINIYS